MDEQQVINKIEDAAETVVPEVAEAVTVVRNNPMLLVGVALVAGSTGAFLGYKLAQRRLELKYSEIAEAEIAEAKEFYSALHKTDDYATPGQVVEKLSRTAVAAGEALRSYQGLEVEEEEIVVSTETEVSEDGTETEVEEVVTSNIFVNGQPLNEDDFDYDTEVAQRSEDHPFVITEEEYFENGADYEQWSVTYYEGDDVVATDDDKVFEDSDRQIGPQNLKRFGHGSKDRNIVYVRNTKIGRDFEVIRHQGKYTEIVLGYIQHTDNSLRHFRGGDD